ncbi:unnamed protein product [Dicrocoelium dendriticum]|nr:unnamed protein product [Dicrocoelium dendriticum]
MSPFLFNFTIEDVLVNALEGFQGSGVELLPCNHVTDLDYADDIVLLGDDARCTQSVLNRLAIKASIYGMTLSLMKCEVLVLDWHPPAPVLTLQGTQLEQVDNFVYLGSCVTADDSIGKEISLRIAKAGSAFANLWHLWRRRDVSLLVKGSVYNACIRAVLLYGSESMPIRVNDLCRPLTMDVCGE